MTPEFPGSFFFERQCSMSYGGRPDDQEPHNGAAASRVPGRLRRPVKLAQVDDVIGLIAAVVKAIIGLGQAHTQPHHQFYWIMHGLYGLQQLGLTFELKGGTSLSN